MFRIARRRPLLLALPPVFKLLECQLALSPVAFLPVADFVFERRQQVECDVCRLKVLGISMSDVVDE